MNSETIEAIFGVLKTADGGCNVCVRRLLIEFVGRFPSTRELIINLIQNDEGLDWEEYEGEI